MRTLIITSTDEFITFVFVGFAACPGIGSIIQPSLSVHAIGWDMWGVLGFGFLVDGWVLSQTIRSLEQSRPKGMSFLEHCRRIRDPTTAAVLMEDGAACLGILIAGTGIGATQYTGIDTHRSLYRYSSPIIWVLILITYYMGLDTRRLLYGYRYSSLIR